MSFIDINIKSCYESGIDDIVSSFYEPVLSNAVKYDRIAGFFSSSSLAIAARGLSNFIRNGGKMRLISSPILTISDAQIIKKIYDNPDSLTDKDVGICFEDIEDEFVSNHVKALGWMLQNNMLDMKLAVVLNESGMFCTKNELAELGIFHQKVGIMEDGHGNRLSFSGSINESATAWINNDEEFKVFKEWCGLEDFFMKDASRFDDFWYNRRKNVKVFDLPTAIKENLIRYSGSFDMDSISLKRYHEKKNKTAIFESDISLFPYQNEALLKWKENGYVQLFEMATGTGKTRTAIAGIDYLLHKHKKLIVIIACPQNMLSIQWKGELEKLNVHFDIVEIIDGTNLQWKSSLRTLLLKNSTGFANHCVIYTTHITSSSNEFIDTIQRFKDNNVDVLFIGDEVHWLGASKLRSALLDEYKYRIGLSATPSRWFDDFGTQLLVDYFDNAHFEFTLKDALHTVNPITGKHFLVNYYYYIKHTTLTEDEVLEYANITSRLSKLYQAKDKSPDMSVKYERLLEKRANIIKNADNKYVLLETILDELTEKGILENLIIFVSPQQMVRVKDILSAKNIIFHKLTQEEGTKPEEVYGGKSEREYIIQKFRNKTYKVLVAIKCLDEGIDIPSACCGILMASSTNPREYVQRIGRIIRQDEAKSFAYLYDFCVDTINEVGEYAEIERKIRSKEQLRMREIAENAINSFDALDNILNLN